MILVRKSKSSPFMDILINKNKLNSIDLIWLFNDKLMNRMNIIDLMTNGHQSSIIEGVGDLQQPKG